jgi:hypothetical protein
MPRPVTNIVRARVCVTLRTELVTFRRTAATLSRSSQIQDTLRAQSAFVEQLVALAALRARLGWRLRILPRGHSKGLDPHW